MADPSRPALRDALLVLGVLGVAVALRLPYLHLIPAFSDETLDVMAALRILRGEIFPLADVSSPYAGSLWNWMLAAVLRVGSLSIYAPRILILILALLTIPATYLLGRAWGGHLGGLLAAGLLAAAPLHIVVNSHVAWGNCATPLFTTLAVWTLWESVRARERESVSWSSSHALTLSRSHALVLSGLFWGLAFQTHPSVLALLLPAAGFFAWKARPLLRTRWPYLAAGLFALVNLNLLIYNLTSGFDSVGRAMAQSAEYSQYAGLSPLLYLRRLALLGLGLYQDLGGAITNVGRLDYGHLARPGFWPITVLAVGGLIREWRRGNLLPLLLAASMMLLLPLFNGKYNPLLNGRYLAPLLPILFACVGSLLASWYANLRRADRPERRPVRARLDRIGLVLLTIFLLVHPLFQLGTYYQQELARGRNNARLFRVFEQIQEKRRSGESVVIDSALEEQRLHPGAGWVGHAFRTWLSLNDVAFLVADPGADTLLSPAVRCRDHLIVLSTRNPGLDQTIERLGLRTLEGRAIRGHPPVDDNPHRAFVAYRLPGGREC